MDLEFNKMVIDIELRSLMDINGWRDFSDNEKKILTQKQQEELLFLCPNNFSINNPNSYINALEIKNKILELIKYRSIKL